MYKNFVLGNFYSTVLTSVVLYAFRTLIRMVTKSLIVKRATHVVNCVLKPIRVVIYLRLGRFVVHQFKRTHAKCVVHPSKLARGRGPATSWAQEACQLPRPGCGRAVVPYS